MRRRSHSGGEKPKVKTQLPRGGACSHSAAQLPVWLADDCSAACGLTCAAVELPRREHCHHLGLCAPQQVTCCCLQWPAAVGQFVG